MVDGAPGAWISTQDGRHDLASELRRAVGEYRTVVLTGAPGTGKTSLLDGLAFELRADGTTVHQVRCLPALQDRRLGALDALVDSGGDASDSYTPSTVTMWWWSMTSSGWTRTRSPRWRRCMATAPSLPVPCPSKRGRLLSTAFPPWPTRFGSGRSTRSPPHVWWRRTVLTSCRRSGIGSSRLRPEIRVRRRGTVSSFADTERSAPPASMSVHVDRAAALLARLGREERITLGALGRAGTALPAACLPGRIGLLAGLDLVVVDDDRVSLACEPLGRPRGSAAATTMRWRQ